MAVDLHSHILPGIDDGPADLEGAVALARAYVDAGIDRVVATPHVNARWGSQVYRAMQAYETLASRLANDSLALRLDFGGEVALSTALDLDEDELRHHRLADGEWLLIEPPSQGPSIAVHSMVFEVQSKGNRVLLAHPERCQTFQDDLDLLESLVDGGIRTQITASALTGRFGSTAQKAAGAMFKRGLVHTIASDAHHATERPPGMVDELKRSGHKDMIQWLCHDMPTWILDGGEEPPRPESSSRRKGADRGLLGRLGFNRQN